MVETMEASDFLQGGEIAFTTGLGLDTRLQLMVGYMKQVLICLLPDAP